MDKTAYILFTRIPVPGRVKTRLLPRLSEADCAALQKAMTLDTAHTLAKLDGDLYVFYSDEGSPALLEGLPKQARLYPQVGADLGERMYHALETILALGYENSLLLGSDLPFLAVEDVSKATRLLQAADILFCPSPDGGYWLVGMHAPFRAVFSGQKYGTGSVLRDAVACCIDHGLQVELGPTRRDLDTPEDFDEFLRMMETSPIPLTGQTATWLRSL